MCHDDANLRPPGLKPELLMTSDAALKRRSSTLLLTFMSSSAICQVTQPSLYCSR
jgi:hypothetical protein